jgi:hypothetical protein
MTDRGREERIERFRRRILREKVPDAMESLVGRLARADDVVVHRVPVGEFRFHRAVIKIAKKKRLDLIVDGEGVDSSHGINSFLQSRARRLAAQSLAHSPRRSRDLVARSVYM